MTAVTTEPQTVVAQATAVEQASELSGEQRRERFAEYLQILRRNHEPKANDAKKLKALMDQLGIDGARVKNDLAAVERVAALESQTADVDALTKELSQADRDFVAWCTEADAVIQPLQRERQQRDMAIASMRSRLQRLRRIARQLDELQAKRAELFGVEAPPPTKADQNVRAGQLPVFDR